MHADLYYKRKEEQLGTQLNVAPLIFQAILI